MSPLGRRTVLAAALLAPLGTVATACGSGSDPSPATGVDELVVPTPTPDPADFGDVVDNPWLALDAGPRTYTASDGALVEQRVATGPDVAGVATTAVTLGADTDYLAQDRRGNVWWFGRAGEWEAGVDGALAGLVMAADPRVGDGYVRAEVPGATLLAEVVSVEAVVDGRSRAYDDVVVLDVTTDGVVTRSSYARDVGLVRQETAEGLAELELDEAS